MRKWIMSFLVSFPLIFVLFFFGFFPPFFDAVIYTDNIVGEGYCHTYVSSLNESFAYLYRGDAYFGKDLKTLKLRDLRYNIDSVTLDIFGVDEADILSFDISIFNTTVTHLNSEGLTHPFSRTVNYAVDSSETPLIHILIDNPDEGTNISLTGFDFIPFWFWISYFGAIVLVSALLALVLARILFIKPVVFRLLISGTTVMVAILSGCFFCGSFPYVDYTDLLLNWLLLFSVALLINSLTLPWLGTILISLLTELW